MQDLFTKNYDTIFEKKKYDRNGALEVIIFELILYLLLTLIGKVNLG